MRRAAILPLPAASGPSTVVIRVDGTLRDAGALAALREALAAPREERLQDQVNRLQGRAEPPPAAGTLTSAESLYNARVASASRVPSAVPRSPCPRAHRPLAAARAPMFDVARSGAFPDCGRPLDARNSSEPGSNAPRRPLHPFLLTPAATCLVGSLFEVANPTPIAGETSCHN